MDDKDEVVQKRKDDEDPKTTSKAHLHGDKSELLQFPEEPIMASTPTRNTEIAETGSKNILPASQKSNFDYSLDNSIVSPRSPRNQQNPNLNSKETKRAKDSNKQVLTKRSSARTTRETGDVTASPSVQKQDLTPRSKNRRIPQSSNSGNDSPIKKTSSTPRTAQSASIDSRENRMSSVSRKPTNSPITKPNTRRSITSNEVQASIGPESTSSKDSYPTCSKHAQIASSQKLPLPFAAQPTLCETCSKSMLAYILMVQDFLNGVATEVSKQVNPLGQCVECVKESIRLPSQTGSFTPAQQKQSTLETSQPSSARDGTKIRSSGDPQRGEKYSGDKDSAFISNQSLGSTRKPDQRLSTVTNISNDSKQSSNTALSPGVSMTEETKYTSYSESRVSEATSGHPDKQAESHSERHLTEKNNPNAAKSSKPCHHGDSKHDPMHQSDTNESSYNYSQHEQDIQKNRHPYPIQNAAQKTETYIPTSREPGAYVSTNKEHETHVYHLGERVPQPTQPSWDDKINDFPAQSHTFSPTMESLLPSPSSSASHGMDEVPTRESFQSSASSPFAKIDCVDGILSTLYNAELGMFEAAKSPSSWNTITELLQKQESPITRSNSEAFVTQARTNAEALGCLVLGSSLLLCRTTKTLCVLVSDGVSTAFMAPLSAIFHVVQNVRSLDSLGTTKLALLDQPELGISFGKLNVWRLEKFSKCVYLSPDTMVVQNCDELFCHEELSAVPDIGWPDCFNSGVFVFAPDLQTFWHLLEFSEKQGSYDGGDQGLLNAYFNSWSQDIHKKLSFIYNLMANVSYTYTPAFKQFGRNVKIVQFLGPFKPWHVKFYSSTGQIAPSSSVHPTYIQFVHVWLNIFRITILPLFSQEIQTHASSQNIIKAAELLRFFSSPIESEFEFLLAPPSVRLRPSNNPNLTFETQQRQYQETKDESVFDIDDENPSESENSESCDDQVFQAASKDDSKDKFSQFSRQLTGVVNPEEDEQSLELKDVSQGDSESTAEPDEPGDEPRSAAERILPGSEVGDYQGMMAWEQGRMDYQGSASSDTIIKRLHYLMGKPDRLV